MILFELDDLCGERGEGVDGHYSVLSGNNADEIFCKEDFLGDLFDGVADQIEGGDEDEDNKKNAYNDSIGQEGGTSVVD